MATSILFKSPGASTDIALPMASADSNINAGSMFLLDFLRLGSWNPATDTVADGATVGNLVSGATAGSLRIPTAGDLTFVAGKGFQTKNSLGLGRVQIGAGTDYFQSNLTHDFLISMWVTYPAVDPTGHIGQLLSKGVQADYAQLGPMFAHRYINGGDGTAKMDASGPNGNTFAAVGSPAGKHQFALAKVGSNILLFKDNVLFKTAARNTPDLTANGTPLNFGNGSAAGMYAAPGIILHRIYGEDLTISGLTAGAVVAADYTYNSTRFV